VNNFVSLARSKYFDATQCHRNIPTFVVQCGDPTATGRGGPGY
jgi:peptidyl-prolyl cis-trans isomerase B (cyclophilin B)